MLFFRREERYVLDSSSIIDGRVVNLFEKKFDGDVSDFTKGITRRFSVAQSAIPNPLTATMWVIW